MVGYDGGRDRRRGGSPTTSWSRRSEHIPRIQEAQASAYHVLRELVERARASGRRLGESDGARAGARRAWRARSQGVGFRPLRLPPGARRAGSAAGSATTSAASCSRSRATPAAVERFLDRLAARGAAAGRGRARAQSSARAPRRARASRSSRARGGGAADAPVAPDAATCDACLRRAARSRRPPLPLPVRQLHRLRPALHDRARRPLRPRAHDDGRLRDVRGVPGRVRRPGWTAASTPQPNACPDCGPRARLLDARGRRRRGRRRGRGGRGGAARRPDRRGQGPRRLPPRVPRRRRARPSPRCARASTARTSRSR